jgi:hypothetical protein
MSLALVSECAVVGDSTSTTIIGLAMIKALGAAGSPQ